MIELQQVHLSRSEHICGSTRERLIASDGYHMAYRPELAAIVVTLVPHKRTPGARMVQSIIPWHLVLSVVPAKPVLNEIETPWYKVRSRTAAGPEEAMEAQENQKGMERQEKRRTVLEQNRKKRWEGK